jgi:hypothetical protein
MVKDKILEALFPEATELLAKIALPDWLGTCDGCLEIATGRKLLSTKQLNWIVRCRH